MKLNKKDDDHGAESNENKMRKKKKKSKKTKKLSSKILPIIAGFVWLGIFTFYYALNFIISKGFQKMNNTFAVEINLTYSLSSTLYLVENSLNQYLFNQTQNILNKKPDQSVKNLLNYMYVLDSNQQEEHASNIGLHTSNYKTDWNNVWVQDACTTMGTASAGKSHSRTATECKSYDNGLINQGLAVAYSSGKTQDLNFNSIFKKGIIICLLLLCLIFLSVYFILFYIIFLVLFL